MEIIIQYILDVLAPIGITEPVLRLMLVNALLGISIYLTLYTGLFSLANAGFMAIGAYVGAVLTKTHDAPLLVALLAGMAVPALVALIIGLPTLRLRDIYLAIATIGFGEVVRIVLENFDNAVASIMTWIEGERVRYRYLQGARGFKNIPRLTETWHLVLFLIIVVYLLIRLHRSRLGRAMAAVRQDEKAAANMGINVVYVKTVSFVLGAALAGAAGVFYANYKVTIQPATFGFDQAVDILAFAVLGGTATWLGPIVGGMTLTAIPEVLRFLKEYRGVFTGAVLLGVIVYLPGGIVNPAGWARLYRRLRGGPSARGPDDAQPDASSASGGD